MFVTANIEIFNSNKDNMKTVASSKSPQFVFPSQHEVNFCCLPRTGKKQLKFVIPPIKNGAQLHFEWRHKPSRYGDKFMLAKIKQQKEIA